MDVDEFIKAKVLPEFWPVVAEIRSMMHLYAPGAKESIAYGIPAYKANKIFAVISPTKKDITLSFTHGTEFNDKYGLLKGVGKVSRHVKFKKVENINEPALRDYIAQALKIDAK